MKMSRKSAKADKIFGNTIGGGNLVQDSRNGLDFLMSPQSAARYLDVSVKFIYERIQSGEIKSEPIGNRIKRIRKIILDEWLASQTKKNVR